jgi:hypothetical protein
MTGNEPIIAEALAYLERRGIPRGDVRGLAIHAEVGDAIRMDVSLYVQDETPRVDELGTPLLASDVGDAPEDRPSPGPCSAALPGIGALDRAWCQLREGHVGDHESGPTRWRDMF